MHKGSPLYGRLFLPLLLLVSGLLFSTAVSAQEKKVTVSLKNRPLSELIRSLERQTGMTFFYSSPAVDVSQPVTVDCSGGTLSDALDIALKGTSVSYSISGNRVMLFPRPAGTAPDDGLVSVKGVVQDEAGEPVIGAYVYQKSNRQNGTVTDADGSFSINAPAGTLLIASSIGYLEAEMPAASRMDFVLFEDTEQLDDVVVIGYGSVKKKDLTGAIAHVKTEQYSTQSYTNALDMLSGTVAGFNSNFGTSASGSSSMEIRGPASLSANNTPLVVLDGVIFNGSINDINPSDIESVEVLKDASSAAVFGARAAAGVLMINTKNGGSSDKMSINFSAKIGLQGFTNLILPNNLGGFLQRREDYLTRVNGEKQKGYYAHPDKLPAGIDLQTWLNYDASYDPDPVNTWMTRMNLTEIEQANYLAGNEYNWYDLCTRTGLRQDYNVSLSNGSGRSKYFVSLGRTDNQGTFYGDDYEIFRSRVNVETKVTDFLTVGVNAQFSDKNNPGTQVSYGNVLVQSPLASPYDADGNIKWYATDDPGFERNPLVTPMDRAKLNKTQSLFANLFAEVRLPLGFNYRVSWINRYNWSKNYYYDSTNSPDGDKVGGHGNRVNSSLYEWQVDNILSWRKTFGVHDFYATFLYNAEKNQSWRDEEDNTNFSPSEALGYHLLNIGSTPSIKTQDTYSTGNAIMARLNYTLLNRYMFTASVRRDGYSAFGINNPYAIFPSGAVAWVLSDEPFFRSRWINTLKLRVSYGFNGNRDIGIYSALAQLGTTKYSTGLEYVSGIYNSTMANSDLKWEKTASLNLGLDFAVADSRVNGSVDVYKMTTTDLLLPRSLPTIIGYDSVMSNLGQLDNKGIELTVNSLNINRPDFRWNSTFTFSANRNQIVHLYGEMIDVVDEDGNVTGQREADDIENRWFIGQAIDRIWDYNFLGIYQLDDAEEATRFGKAPGDAKLEDVKEDGAITQEDKTFQGYTRPRARLGLANSLTLFKNWEISCFIRADLGHYRANGYLKHTSSVENRTNRLAIPYWTPDNPTNKYTRLLTVDTPGFTQYESTGFVRLQDLTIAYNLPKTLLQKVKIDRARLYFNSRNLVTFTRWTGWDPESGNTAMPRIFTFGIDVTL